MIKQILASSSAARRMFGTVGALCRRRLGQLLVAHAFCMPWPSLLRGRESLSRGGAPLFEAFVCEMARDVVDFDGRLLTFVVIEGRLMLFVVIDLLVASGPAPPVLALLFVVREAQELAQGLPLLGFACLCPLGDEVTPRGARCFLRARLIARVLLRGRAERSAPSAVLIVTEIIVMLQAALARRCLFVPFRQAVVEQVEALDRKVLSRRLRSKPLRLRESGSRTHICSVEGVSVDALASHRATKAEVGDLKRP